MLETLWGLKTTAIFDVWTFEHILSGVSVGTGVIAYNKKNIGTALAAVSENLLHPKKASILKHKYDILVLLLIAFAWEAVEFYLETGLLGARVEYWFQGVEFWANRLISDPLMLVLGYWIALKWPISVWPARALSIVWLTTHIFLFPHSMYLHNFL